MTNEEAARVIRRMVEFYAGHHLSPEDVDALTAALAALEDRARLRERIEALRTLCDDDGGAWFEDGRLVLNCNDMLVRGADAETITEDEWIPAAEAKRIGYGALAAWVADRRDAGEPPKGET